MLLIVSPQKYILSIFKVTHDIIETYFSFSGCFTQRLLIFCDWRRVWYAISSDKQKRIAIDFLHSIRIACTLLQWDNIKCILRTLYYFYRITDVWPDSLELMSKSSGMTPLLLLWWCHVICFIIVSIMPNASRHAWQIFYEYTTHTNMGFNVTMALFFN